MKRRIPRLRRRAVLGPQHTIQLQCGFDHLGIGFGEGVDFDSEAAARAWNELREAIMSDWLERRPCTRPWAWWRFDRAMDRPHGRSLERIYLHAHGLLSPAEVEMVEADPSLLVARPYGHDR